jgi:hypothetical protein
MAALRLRTVPIERLTEPIAAIAVPGDGADRPAMLRRSTLNPGRLAVYVNDACVETGITVDEAMQRWPLVRDSIRAECVRGRR